MAPLRLALALALAPLAPARAFAPAARSVRRHFAAAPSTSSSALSSSAECDCAAGSAAVGSTQVSFNTLKGMRVTAVDGQSTMLGDVLEDTSLVVFLRHLGWPYCWSWAKELTTSESQERLRAAGCQGPVFVSIGSPEGLDKFIDQVPTVDRALAFVDDSGDMRSFPAYDAAGFKAIGDDKEAAKEGAAMMSAPSLGDGLWWKYATNVGSIGGSVVPKDMSFGEVPTGVTRLGGEFVIRKKKVVYAYAEPLPGVHPEFDDLVAAAQGPGGFELPW